MKFKYINVFAAVAVMAVASTSCKDSNDDNGGLGNGAVEVEITTDVETKANVTTEYTAGDAMNVYVKSYNSVESDDKVRGVRAELKDGKWVTTPRVGLKEGEVAFFLRQVLTAPIILTVLNYLLISPNRSTCFIPAGHRLQTSVIHV